MTSPGPKISATVCNYNGGDALFRCLDALLAQTYPLEEVAVYDNASEDGSLECVRERFPQVRVVEMGRNEGPSPTRNRALAEAQTPWVLQVDDDVILQPDCLEKLVAETRDSQVVAVMPRAVFASDPDTVHYDGGAFHYIGLMTLRNFFGPRPCTVEPALDIDAAIAMALLLHRDTLNEIGGYEPAYFILFEDHDLSYRLRARGHRIRLVPDAVVLHDEGTPGISWRRGNDYPSQRTFLHSRNRCMLLLRNHSVGALVLGAPGIVFYEGVAFAFAALKGNLWAWCRGKFEFFRAIPRLLRERATIQAGRVVCDGELLQARRLSHAPMVARSRLLRGVEWGIDAVLRGWWGCVRRVLR